jgi:predicted RNA-binding protein with PUA-like domain
MTRAYWLFKQEPSTYNYTQLEKDGWTRWDGVANNLALKHLRNVRKGDKAIFYHTGDERQAVGIMEIVSDPYPDPKNNAENENKSNDRLPPSSSSSSESDGRTAMVVVVDVRPAGRLKKPVTLQQIKNDPAFSQWELVRLSRLSVMPVPEKLWERIMKMSG